MSVNAIICPVNIVLKLMTSHFTSHLDDFLSLKINSEEWLNTGGATLQDMNHRFKVKL